MSDKIKEIYIKKFSSVQKALEELKKDSNSRMKQSICPSIIENKAKLSKFTTFWGISKSVKIAFYYPPPKKKKKKI